MLLPRGIAELIAHPGSPFKTIADRQKPNAFRFVRKFTRLHVQQVYPLPVHRVIYLHKWMLVLYRHVVELPKNLSPRYCIYGMMTWWWWRLYNIIVVYECWILGFSRTCFFFTWARWDRNNYTIYFTCARGKDTKKKYRENDNSPVEKLMWPWILISSR